nr:hypothetical protein [uncultured bacterium]
MPDRALYYPEWHISDPLFLAESLLYWERMACIVPEPNFHSIPNFDDYDFHKVIAEIHEYFIYPLVPSKEQKARVHERIKDFAAKTPPPWCRPEHLNIQHREAISGNKLSYETIELLQRQGWAKPIGGKNFDMQLISSWAANVVMGALADECSSLTMPPITDDPGSFSVKCNLLLRELDSPTGITARKKQTSNRQTTNDVEFNFLLANVPCIGLKPEVASPTSLRKILAAHKNADLSAQRKAFRTKIDEYLQKLQNAEEPERPMIREQFERDIASDHKVLQKELRRFGLESLTSKDGVVALLLSSPVSTIIKGLGLTLALGSTAINYHNKRKEIVDKHWSSWIFSATPQPLSFW